MTDDWRPGSFTKNFSWGPHDKGLRELHSIIRLGFDGALVDVPRALFRNRIKASGRPDFIPLNFFLYNVIRNGVDFVVADELVFQALNFRHSSHFDRLALFCFNLSVVGRWKGAAEYQRTPALWARHYLAERVGRDFGWSSRAVTADDIELFVLNDSRYHAQTARKLATNLSYLYKQGKLSEFKNTKPERWWISSLFLTLDRACNEMLSSGLVPQEERFEEYLIKYGFHQISGPRSLEKDLTAIHFVKLFEACGGPFRFSEAAVLERQRILLPDIQKFANNPEPVGVFHPSNPKARGAIPRACAMLAHYLAGFEWIDIEELENFDVETYVKDHTKRALDHLKARQIKSSISADELLRLTRGE